MKSLKNFFKIRPYLAAFFVLLVLIYTAVSDDGSSVNQWARYDLTKSIVQGHTFKIDAYVSNTVDWATYKGHFYAAKAPGASMLAAPFYFLIWRFTVLTRIGLDNDEFKLKFIDFFVTAVPSAILALVFFLFLELLLNQIPDDHPNKRRPGYVLFAYSLGTLAFPFSGIFWGHQTAAALLFSSFYLLVAKRHHLLSGFLIGWAVLTEYTCLLALPLFIGYLFLKYDSLSKKTAIGKVLAGGFPVAVLFAFYNYACFDGPFRISYTFENPMFGADAHAMLFGILSLPDPKIFYELTFGGYRGIFWICPIMLLALIGWLRALKNRFFRAEGMVCVGVFLAFLFTNASFNVWWGGHTSGPRYLIPALPFIASGLLFVRQNVVFYILLFWSTLNMLLISAVTSVAEDENRNYLFDEILPKVLQTSRYQMNFVVLIILAGVAFVVARRIQAYRRTSL